ncbi:molybdopterin molybdotransferase MoeA [Herbiconiux sp.]|uniref:molybdopterin molybdotransferase MoeA n=1 Tax=Herbiconiux sp. TaxID=1871186 RepID=UPI0025C6C47F|nr:molybdopterin molybdotransferase MoeA [Herbiconiux sp.]
MRTIEDHRREVTALVGTISAGTEVLTVSGEAMASDPSAYAHRVLAADVVAMSSLPAFDNSQMDGYAVLAADLAGAARDAAAHPRDGGGSGSGGSAGRGSGPVTLPVAARVAAGDPFATHLPGTATPVMTGAPIPVGADAVVQIERADPPVFPAEGGEASVTFTAPVEPGTFVRAAGSDVSRGERLLAAGTVLGPAHYGVIAGTGDTSVSVRRRPVVLLVSTGHEIREPGTTLAPGQIFDANTAALTAALTPIGVVVRPAPCRSDDAADLLALLERECGGERDRAGDRNADLAIDSDGNGDSLTAADRTSEHPIDLVVTVGGVSAGAREVVRDALEPLGVEFMKVAMQPGGPQGFGLARLGDAELPVVCLPGNPVSALVSFEAFLRPALLSALGIADPLRERRRGRAAHPFDSPATHHQLRRGIVRPDGSLELIGGPSSHLLHSYANSTVLVHVPVGVTAVAEGDELDYWRIDG